ncbi:hypothetical protein PCANB_001035 [Pneumocystis canis]|nr:hypothetical protein PCANB_001035 [Pneumocystis canis]
MLFTASNKENAPYSDNFSNNEEKKLNKKRVIFSPLTNEDLKETIISTPQTSQKGPPRSILKATPSFQQFKPSNDDSLTLDDEISQKVSFSTLLTSAKPILAGNHRAKKIETYLSFSIFLRSYETISDKALLFQYIPELIQCIKRDAILIQFSDIGDYQMASNAFKVLGYLVSQQEISEIFNPNDAKFFIEYSISALENPSLTKTSAAIHLWFLSVQKLSSTVITPEIADKIISACLKISFPSITISQEKMNVLIRIMNQRPQIFIRRALDWIFILHTCLIDTSRPIREKALQYALEIEKTLHGEPEIGLAIINNMKEKFQGKLMMDVFFERFQEIIKEDGDGIFVAHSWGVLVTIIGASVLLRWNKLNIWLKIIQLCFNHRDISTKIAAQIAWIRLIYVFTASFRFQSIPPKRLILLSQPMQLILNSKSAVSPIKKSAIKTVCALLYSTLRPEIPIKDITVVWEKVIFPLFNGMMKSDEHGAFNGSKILASLFDVEKVKPWREDRLMDNSYIEPSEIPTINSKWIRSNVSILMPAIETILTCTMISKEVKLSVWKNFNKSINFAGNKEIKISFEAMDAVTKICELLKRFWFSPIQQNSSIEKEESTSDIHINLFVELVSISFKTIGHMYFINKLCIIENEVLIPIQTTNSKSSLNQENILTPMAFLFRLFLNPFPHASINKRYIDAISDIISDITLSHSRDVWKIDILLECLSVFDYTKDLNLQLQIWKLFAELSKKFFIESKQFLQVSSFNSTLENKETTKQCNGVFKILEWGIRSQINCLPDWETLFNVFYQTVENILGITETGYKIIESFAESLLQESPDTNRNVYNISRIIIKKVKFPLPDNTLKTNLSVSHLETTKTSKKTISFENLNVLISNLLAFSYKHDPDEFILAFIQSVSSYIEIIPIYEIVQSLQCIQGGLSLWISDEKELLKKGSKETFNTIKELWSIVLLKLKGLDSHESSLLHSLSLLLESGFKSKNHSILSSTIEIWNETFGKQTVLDYPFEIIQIMEPLYKMFKILLPSFPIPLNNEVIVTTNILSDSGIEFIPENTVYKDSLLLSSPSVHKSKIIENSTNHTLQKRKTRNTLNSESLESYVPSSPEKAHVNKKIRASFKPSTIMTRRKSAELAREKNIDIEEKKTFKHYTNDLNIEKVDSLTQNSIKKNSTPKKSILRNKHNDSTYFASFEETLEELVSNKRNNSSTPSIEDSVKNKKRKRNKTSQDDTKNQIVLSYKGEDCFPKSINDVIINESPSLRKSLRLTQKANHFSKTSLVSTQTSIQTDMFNSEPTNAISDSISIIQSENIDSFVYFEKTLPKIEQIIPEMTPESLLKLESILLSLQHTIWKTKEKFILKT